VGKATVLSPRFLEYYLICFRIGRGMILKYKGLRHAGLVLYIGMHTRPFLPLFIYFYSLSFFKDLK
jgi:hypothetical protein